VHNGELLITVKLKLLLDRVALPEELLRQIWCDLRAHGEENIQGMIRPRGHALCWRRFLSRWWGG
jgi:hypothetical protein